MYFYVVGLGAGVDSEVSESGSVYSRRNIEIGRAHV